MNPKNRCSIRDSLEELVWLSRKNSYHETVEKVSNGGICEDEIRDKTIGITGSALTESQDTPRKFEITREVLP